MSPDLSFAAKLANPCLLCMHKCKVNRSKNEKGICKSGEKPSVYSYSTHYGEEPPISGLKGSGAIFFGQC
ncbi:MAG: radical SAM protein, partial [Candidatus Omnitrophota bacterium]